ncbi:hypothetical protein [Actinomadura atramentaria]|uniref:hypothetical protein n=1 Tax=Actinomadura atramentaria TaxID=1990 RepID=UPI00037982EF|nr:hypothetical protein [Actinomadura atramentaria]
MPRHPLALASSVATHHGVVAVDVVGFGRRSPAARQFLRPVRYRLLDAAAPDRIIPAQRINAAPPAYPAAVSE